MGRPFQPNGLLVGMAMKVLLFCFEGLVKMDILCFCPFSMEKDESGQATW